MFKILEEEYNLVPSLDNNQEYRAKEGEYLKELINDDKLIGKIKDLLKTPLKIQRKELIRPWRH